MVSPRLNTAAPSLAEALSHLANTPFLHSAQNEEEITTSVCMEVEAASVVPEELQESFSNEVISLPSNCLMLACYPAFARMCIVPQSLSWGTFLPVCFCSFLIRVNGRG